MNEFVDRIDGIKKMGCFEQCSKTAHFNIN